MRVLIAEDSGVLRRALRRAVEGLGHECVEASDGELAWQAFRDNGADVVVSDWIMPGLEGPELCRRVRAEPGRPYTYFIILTVLEEKQHALTGMRSGADDYLTKPVDLDDLQLRLIAAQRVSALHRRLAEREASERGSAFRAGLNSAQERLRAQVAELLHGRVQSRLLLAYHRLLRAEQNWDGDPTAARRLVSEAKEMIDRVREQEVRQASHLLHPSLLREGLLPALKVLAREYDGEPCVELEVDECLAEADSLPEPLRLAVYRIVEEAVGNVVRHAEARKVVVRIARDDGGVRIEVTDDGRGFEPDALSAGLGLSSIAGRVEELGGDWRLTGAPGGGATLTALLPTDTTTAPPVV